jgi:hypothetical protein
MLSPSYTGILTGTSKKEEVMAGIIDFFTDMGGNSELAGKFITTIAQPDCTQQDLLDFFSDKGYQDVTKADIGKLFDNRKKLKDEFKIPVRSDY